MPPTFILSQNQTLQKMYASDTTLRLHQAHVLLRDGKREQAEAVLATVTEEVLQRQKQKLVAELAAPGTK